MSDGVSGKGGGIVGDADQQSSAIFYHIGEIVELKLVVGAAAVRDLLLIDPPGTISWSRRVTAYARST
jgi:hypothetical protein